MPYTLDHLAIACTDLAAARVWLQDLLGVRLSERGIHARMGTHNHLVSLGPDTYLELIAIDPLAPPPAHPRWFDLDNFSGDPRPANWIARCSDLEQALALAPEGAGQPMGFERGAYRWSMGVPRDGKLPFDGCFPALIEWHSPMPAAALPDHGLRLAKLVLTHPDRTGLQKALSPFGPLDLVDLAEGPDPRLSFQIETPRGVVCL